MCFHSQQSKDAQTLEHRFSAEFVNPGIYQPGIFNGFNFPKTPVITHLEPSKIQMFNWGFLPGWTNDLTFRKNTLNAKIETLQEKPSFRNYVNNRCLILIDGFFEWQWLDPQGKQKQKYLITLPDDEPFTVAGIWNTWTSKQTGEIIETYALLTTEANEQMSEIHNSKKRMPMILSREEENIWLNLQPVHPKRQLELKTVKV
jgi:putative SOS response-associated peptidase YedK